MPPNGGITIVWEEERASMGHGLYQLQPGGGCVDLVVVGPVGEHGALCEEGIVPVSQDELDEAALRFGGQRQGSRFLVAGWSIDLDPVSPEQSLQGFDLGETGLPRVLLDLDDDGGTIQQGSGEDFLRHIAGAALEAMYVFKPYMIRTGGAPRPQHAG